VLTAAAMLFCAAIEITSCRSGVSGSEANAATVPSARVATAQSGDIARVLTLAGQFQAYQMVDVHPKVSGYMKKINVDIGDIVHQGQTLAILEVPELKAQLEGTVFELKQSQEEINRAQHEVKSAEALNAALHAESTRMQQAAATRPGLIAQQELDDAQAKDLSSQAQVDSAKASLAAAQQHAEAARADSERVEALENYTTVTAPIAGVVVWRYADTGALIQGGTNSNDSTLPIVRLSQSSLLRLRVPVPEDDVRYVHVGDTLDVRVDSINRSFTGKIVRFTRNVNFETRTMETEVDVENKDLSIAPGMYANTALQLASAKNVVTIPTDALELNSQQQQTVYVLDNSNHVHIRTVTVGLEGSKLAEIKSGISPGELVLIGGQEKYQEGEAVNPLPTQEPASETTQESGGMIDIKGESTHGGAN
ncbi:MAG: efflux RND transporter periplasmic adaptor subunit, partial [Terracidiphilus sp.]